MELGKATILLKTCTGLNSSHHQTQNKNITVSKHVSCCLENSALSTLSQAPRLDPLSQNGFLQFFRFTDVCTACCENLSFLLTC